MGLDRIVCLANSYKHDHRCVAGISLLTETWVRLIGKAVPRCHTRSEARYENGQEPALLDVFEVDVEKPCGCRYHPEDVLIEGKPWRWVRRFNSKSDLNLLMNAASQGPNLMQGYSDRIGVRTFENADAKESLSLVSPEDLWWWVREERGKMRYRANFRMGHLGRIRYDLPVTDPTWLDQLHLLPPGIYPDSLIRGREEQETLLTTSLTEPFEGFHYKLVAGVIHLPA